MKTLMCVFIVFVLSRAGFADPVVWLVPPEDSGYIYIGLLDDQRPKGTINCFGDYDRMGGFAADTAYGDGKATIGGGTFPVITYYGVNEVGESSTYNWSRLTIQFTKGEHLFSLTGRSRPYPSKYSVATWYIGYIYPYPGGGFPLFGLPQVSQKGNNNPYADGTKTIAQRGCCLCAWLAWALYWHQVDWDIVQFNAQMVAKDGYLVRDIIPDEAADILGLENMGLVPYSAANLAKYLGQGYGVIVRVRATGQHWVAATPGMKITGLFGMMDPAERYSSFANTKYKPQAMRILSLPCHNMATHDKWWENPFSYLACGDDGSRGAASAKVGVNKTAVAQKAASRNALRSADTSLTTDAALLFSKISMLTEPGTLIETIEAPGFVLTKEIETLGRTIVDSPNEEHDDEVWVEPDPLAPEPPPDHSEAIICQAPAGEYRVHLTGAVGSSWKLHLFFRDNIRKRKRETMQGIFAAEGRTVAAINHEPGAIVTSFGHLRKLTLGRRILFKDIKVTDVGENEFFCQSQDRTAGARVLLPEGASLPERNGRATVDGRLTAVSPEITIAANSVSSIYGMYEEPAKPLGIPKLWPETANCLLGKLWGKVVSVDDNTAVIKGGAENITVSGLDIPVTVGDFISLQAVLRQSREVRAIPDTTQIER